MSADEDVLAAHELLDAGAAALAAEAALLVAAERRARRHAGEAVDDDRSRPRARAATRCARAHVAGVQVGATSPKSLSLALATTSSSSWKRSTDSTGPKISFAGEVAVVVDVAEHGGRDEVAVGELAAEARRRR